MFRGAECWADRKKERTLHTTEMRMLQWAMGKTRLDHVKGKGKVSFYIAQYLVRWTAQRASRFFSPDRPVHSDTVFGFSGKHSSDAAITREDKITHISTIVYS